LQQCRPHAQQQASSAESEQQCYSVQALSNLLESPYGCDSNQWFTDNIDWTTTFGSTDTLTDGLVSTNHDFDFTAAASLTTVTDMQALETSAFPSLPAFDSVASYTPTTSATFQEQHPTFSPTLDLPSYQSAQTIEHTVSTITQATGRSSHSPSLSPSGSDNKIVKRKRNTEAARRYRKRKEDRVTELEEMLAAVSRERDELRLRLAKAETEVDVLRGMVKQ